MADTTRHVITDEDGQVLAVTCTDQPLTDETRAALAALARAAFRDLDKTSTTTVAVIDALIQRHPTTEEITDVR